MIQIANVPSIRAVKKQLETMKADGLIQAWELPYEELLTRLTAAIFFLTAADDSQLPLIWQELEKSEMFQYRENTEKKLSQLDWRVEFNKGFVL